MNHVTHALRRLHAALTLALLVALTALAGNSAAFAGVPVSEPAPRVVKKRTVVTTSCCARKCDTGCRKSSACARCSGYTHTRYIVDRPFIVNGKTYQHQYVSWPYATYILRDEPGYPGPAVYGYRRPHYYNHRPYLGYSKYHGWKPYYGRTYVDLDYAGNRHGRFVYRGGTAA